VRARYPMPWYERSSKFLTTVYVGLVLAFTGIILALTLVSPLSLDRSFLIVGGLVVLAGTIWKPWWFWEHHNAFLLRGLVGDRFAAIIYTATGVVMLYFGVFTNPHVFRR